MSSLLCFLQDIVIALKDYMKGDVKNLALDIWSNLTKRRKIKVGTLSPTKLMVS